MITNTTHQSIILRRSRSCSIFFFFLIFADRMLLENDHFLLELTKLFQQQRVKTSGSLSLTMKRYDGRTKPARQLTKKQRLEAKNLSSSLPNSPTTSEPLEYKCLVRAVFGSKKLSTVVAAKDVNRFQLAYSNLLKANMDTLKKKAKETKATVGQPSNAQASSHVPMSPTTATAASSSSKKTPTTPAKKK